MGDKSPKSTNKQAQQKQTKDDAVKQKKDEVESSKRVVKTEPKK